MLRVKLHDVLRPAEEDDFILPLPFLVFFWLPGVFGLAPPLELSFSDLWFLKNKKILPLRENNICNICCSS